LNEGVNVTDLAAPKALGTAGKRLWKAIVDDIEPGWRLDARELHLLERACRVEDEVRALEAAIDRDGPMAEGSRGQATVHPAISEARQLRLVQARLLGGIELCNPRHGSATANGARARVAANARWAQHG
jgi:P27 family predicted phage terminase small subunit